MTGVLCRLIEQASPHLIEFARLGSMPLGKLDVRCVIGCRSDKQTVSMLRDCQARGYTRPSGGSTKHQASGPTSASGPGSWRRHILVGKIVPIAVKRNINVYLASGLPYTECVGVCREEVAGEWLGLCGDLDSEIDTPTPHCRIPQGYTHAGMVQGCKLAPNTA